MAKAIEGQVLPRSAEAIEATINDWIVATAGDEVLGCVSLLGYTSGLVEVRSLVVAERYQGLRIGSKLVEALLGEARRREVPRLFALTRKVAFFERFDFQVAERSLFPEKVWQDCRLCPLIDNCDLEELAAVCRELGRWEFQIVVTPLRIAGGTGSPVNPVAVF